MAILCSYCGKPLQKDDARFCHNCGMLIPSHPFSPQSLSQSSQKQRSRSGSATPVEPGASPSYTTPANMAGTANNPPPEIENSPVRPVPPVESQPAPQQDKPGSSTRFAGDEPPKWMSRLNRNSSSQSGLLEEPSPDGVQPSVPTQSAAALEQAKRAPDETPRPAPGTGTPPAAGKYIPGRGILPGKREASSQRELRVKVWEQNNQIKKPVEPEKFVPKTLPVTPQLPVSTEEDVEVLPGSVADSASAQARKGVSVPQSLPEGQKIEDLPTGIVDAIPAEQTVPAISSTPTLSEVQEVEDLPTRPLVAYSQEKPQARVEEPVLEHEQQNTSDAIEDIATLHLPTQAASVPLSQQKAEYVVVRDNTPAPGVPPTRDVGQMLSQPGFAPFAAQPPMQMPPISMNNNVSETPVQNSPQLKADAPSRRRSRKWMPLVIALVVLVIFAAAGVGGWMVLAQPFAVEPITTPLVSFQDQSLGVSVQYPRGWMVNIDRSKSVITFYDSSHTDQVTIQVASATSVNLAAYLQQQATAQKVTATKTGSTLTFGGSTWEQLQGNVSLSGASYSEVFLASKHGTHLYTLAQLSPQTSYADEEKIIFSPMRASWQFLS